MDSIIEVQRQTHEEIEHLERALFATLSKPQPTHLVRLQNEHKASQLLDRIHSRVVALNNLYEDQDTRKAEIDSLSAPHRQDDLSSFYDRLSKIQEHHAKYPDSVVGGFELELAAFVDEAEELEGEEFEQDDRACLSSRSSLISDLRARRQPSPCCSRERRATANTLTCTLITQRTTISSILASDWHTCSI